jgi:chromosome segregation ATPase
MRKKLEEDTAQLEALRTEVSEQRQRQAAIREEYSLLSEEFSRLRDPKTTEQIDHYSASISVMEEVRRRIKASAGYLPDAPDLPGEVPAALQTDLDAAGSALKTLRSGIDQYLDIYNRHTAAEQS